jgi:hypothetical protein
MFVSRVKQRSVVEWSSIVKFDFIIRLRVVVGYAVHAEY